VSDPLGLLLPQPKREATPGAWLEFDDQGIPYRMSTDRDSPYYYPDGWVTLRVTLDGKLPGCCVGYDRKRGYVETRPVIGERWWFAPGVGWPDVVPENHPDRWTVVRRHGKVEVGWA